MTVITESIQFRSKAEGQVHEITGAVEDILNNQPLVNGIVTIFTPSSTSALTTIEYEPGCVSDIQRYFNEVIPADRSYAHNARWGDGNGHSHLRAAVLGASITIPFVGKPHDSGHLAANHFH